jgi:1,4-dihydroxy-2-naphthoyl-CoA hydrolase
MSYNYYRTVRLSDTDAAGVVYFANVLNICHEAYEESLVNANINIKIFLNNSAIAIPIVSASVNFFRPIFCGDRLFITLKTQKLNNSEFEINYCVYNSSDRVIAKAKTKHVCIQTLDRKKINLPDSIARWLVLTKDLDRE